MNEGKVCTLFKYPNSFIRNLKNVKYFSHTSFRQVEGVASALSTWIEKLKAPDYITIWGGASKMGGEQ